MNESILISYRDWFQNAENLVKAGIPKALDMTDDAYIAGLPQPRPEAFGSDSDLAWRFIVEPRLKPSKLLALAGIDSMISSEIDLLYDWIEQRRIKEIFRTPHFPYLAQAEILERSAAKKENMGTYYEGVSLYIKNPAMIRAGIDLLMPGSRFLTNNGHEMFSAVPILLLASNTTFIGGKTVPEIVGKSKVLSCRRDI